MDRLLAGMGAIVDLAYVGIGKLHPEGLGCGGRKLYPTLNQACGGHFARPPWIQYLRPLIGSRRASHSAPRGRR
jgi:hypothetical protein